MYEIVEKLLAGRKAACSLVGSKLHRRIEPVIELFCLPGQRGSGDKVRIGFSKVRMKGVASCRRNVGVDA